MILIRYFFIDTTILVLFNAKYFSLNIDEYQVKKHSHSKAGKKCSMPQNIRFYVESYSFTIFCFTIKL